MKIFYFLVLLLEFTQAQEPCTLMWDTNNFTNICPVMTSNNDYCKFPFIHNGITYSSCIINGPNNVEKIPRCKTSSDEWADCLVPTNSIIDFVTTRKRGNAGQNGVGLNGGVMIWIYGKRFAHNMFSFTPTVDKSNEVFLIGDYASYQCEIHSDKVTDTQITCYTPTLPSDNYLVRVKVNGDTIPLYQYVNVQNAFVRSLESNTPKIYSMTPVSGPPGTMIKITGDFKTACYTRDVDSCGDDAGQRITRIYFGGQICDLINPETNEVYQPITQNELLCRISGKEINVFNTTILVSEEYGRSKIVPNNFFVSPDEKIYNFQTYPVIKSISHSSGSVLGGTRLTITGSYFYNDEFLPAEIDISGTPCKLIDFKTNEIESTLICETPPQPSQTPLNFGNRGIRVISDNVLTSSNNLKLAQPSSNASTSISSFANYSTSETSPKTVWINGVLQPAKTGMYEIILATNGNGELYLNKTLVTSGRQRFNLTAGESYLYEAIASRSSQLTINVNLRLLETSLIDQVSGNVKHEIQDLDITSTINPETFEINTTTLNVIPGVGEVQKIQINSINLAKYTLALDGVETYALDFESTGLDVQKALNDLVHLTPNLVNVTQMTSPDGFTKIFNVKFSPSLGDVPSLEEGLKNVKFLVEETTKGVPSGDRVNLMIENRPTELFDLTDTESNIKNSISESFGIRCPPSILPTSPDVVYVNDFETTDWTDRPLTEFAFCGKTSRRNFDSFFSVSYPMVYRHLCFAYKVKSPMKQIGLYVYYNNQYLYPLIKIDTIADFEWHYTCLDMYDSLVLTYNQTFPIASLTVSNAFFGDKTYPSDTFIDAVSVRKTRPIGYDDPRLITHRRLLPSLQIIHSTYSLIKDPVNSKITISYRPNNCSYNLKDVFVRQNITINVTRTRNASPPVTGTFGVSWNGINITGIPADITDVSLKSYFETFKDMGALTVSRSEDCGGFKWRIRWETGGDKPPFIILSRDLSGINAGARVLAVQDGGVNFFPIMDDFSSTLNWKPQVRVKVNNILSKCISSCDFEWLETSTPRVLSINTTNKNSIVLTGNGFSLTPVNNQVKIGDTLCQVLNSTETQITCKPGNGPVGVYSFSLNVLEKGTGKIETNTKFEFELTLSDINPKTSGTGGGLKVNITGSGFSQNTTVKIDGNQCPILFTSYNLIICQVPPNPTSLGKQVDVNVTDGVHTSTLKFNYDYVNTPIVTSLSLTKLNVLGGELLTIIGTRLPNPPQVSIGGKRVDIISSNASKILIRTLAMEAGVYDLEIPTETLGNVMVDQRLEYMFYISSLSPKLSSIQGGSRITIRGNGFNSNCSLNQVNYERYSCKIQACTKDTIVCETENSQTVHVVTNRAPNSKFGFGYSWDKPYLEIELGEYVEWTWSPPNEFIEGIKFKIEQLKDSFSTEAEGFSSGSPVRSGSFRYQFNRPGIYNYWSGYIELGRVISLRGVVVVREARVDKELVLEVSQNGYKAQKCVFPFEYKSINYSSCTNVDKEFSWCSPSKVFNGQYLPCESGSIKRIISSPCNVSSNPYTLTLTTCKVPLITSITPLNVLQDTNITIIGTGFSFNKSDFRVYLNETDCPITQITDIRIVCNLPATSGLIPNQLFGLRLWSTSNGNAISEDYFQLKFTSSKTSLSESKGSLNGGAVLTLSGDGFTENTIIYIGNTIYNSEFLRLSYNSVQFKTRPMSEGTYDVKVGVNGLESVYKQKFTYQYTASSSPQIIAVKPLIINSQTQLVINGLNFGSNLTVNIGDQLCLIDSVNSTQIQCTLKGLELGPQSVSINVRTFGNSLKSNIVVTGEPRLGSILPSSGSVNGGTRLKILGNGFSEMTKINLDGSVCVIYNMTINEINCVTTNHTPGDALVKVETGSVVYNNSLIKFRYDLSLTPVVLSISQTSSVLTIIGTSFSNRLDEVSVKIGESVCKVLTSNLTEIKCELSLNSAGTYPVMVNIDSKGLGNSNVTYEYKLEISSLSSSSGSLAGGLMLRINGTGFSGNTEVSICDKQCKVSSSSFTWIECQVPSSDSNTDLACKLRVTENGLTREVDFQYKLNLTSRLISSSPLKGGSGGGTLITISGSNFFEGAKVTIAGVFCDIITLTSVQITCRTNSYDRSSIKSLIQVYLPNIGNALSNSYFEYIDLWSSPFTWGNNPPPSEGEVAVIGQNQIVYFDAKTPVLKGLIIIGGSLIFDDSQDVHLQAEYIIITSGGKLQIGSEDKPFEHNAEITMYGNLRSIELPIFGSKVIALRNGTIDFHGKPVGVTWTHLGETVQPGSSKIVLKEPVDWTFGSEIVIATTGDKFSPRESEVRTIVSKSADNRSLVLDKPLNFTHLSETRTLDGLTIEIRAEVGLLTRNIKYRGHNDDSWNSLKSAQACPQGFNPSEFATQTCFLGRYGDEIGSDEFGATILIHSDMSAPKTRQDCVVRIQNVEFYHVGQSFRLGRYPIHFHLNGNMSLSYVKECSIRKSFNRAINLHGTNYVTIEKNFIYDIMGGAYFMEDGVEIGNVYKYNLAIFVKSSSSLLTEDSTPAAFWVTNPNNTYLHNAVAGCSHFGFWYRLLDRPDGPSYNPNYCPKKIPFGKFFNNTVHSSGRMGIWIFPGYTPSVTGSCWDSKPSVARFESLTAYGNEKGAEWVFSNNIQFKNFLIFDQFGVGIETKNVVNNNAYSSNIKDLVPTFYNEQTGPAIIDSIIIGNTDKTRTKSLYPSGLVLAWDRGQLIKNVSFINFPDQDSHAMRGPEIIGTCVEYCGGWVNKFKELKFSNVYHKTIHRWDWDLIYHDLDGTLTGTPNGVVVYNNNMTKANPSCSSKTSYKSGSVCTNSSSWIRFAFNKLKPELVNRVNVTNQNGQTATTVKLAKRLTHKTGFMTALEANQEYLFIFEDASFPTNLSYDAGFYNIEVNKFIIIKHKLFRKPDRVFFGLSQRNESLTPLTGSSNHGEWYWHNSTQTFSYILSNKNVAPFTDFDLTGFTLYTCRYVGCIQPTQPSDKAPVKSRPADALFWSKLETWGFKTPIEFPKNGDTVLIPEGKYIVVDTVLPKLVNLQIDGILEFDNKINHSLEVDMIFINGGQLIIGWENDPILTNVEIKLTGSKDSLNFYLPDGFSRIGGKGIGVYGGLDLHGKRRYPPWTQLAQSSFIGANTISLKVPVDWEKGEQIVISPTSYSPQETEVFTIISKSSDNKTLTLNSTLKHTHLGFNEVYQTGESYEIGAGVGLLTRNIKIIGTKYPSQFSDLYGSRIIVSDYSFKRSDGEVMYYKGFARLSHIEFVHPGQFSKNSDDDFKYGILFSNLGAYNYARPSYVHNCSFHHGFSAAIGVSDSNSIPIIDNVIHHTIDYAVRLLSSHSSILKRNFIVLVYWSSTSLTWEAEFNTEYWGAIDAHLADSFILESNLITGAERLGLFYKGDLCPGETLNGMNHSIKDNKIYSSMAGVVILPSFYFPTLKCIRIAGFTVYKSMHWGIYYQGPQSVIVDNNKLVDNFVNVFAYVIEPPPIEHQVSRKTYVIRSSLIVGQSKTFNCTSDLRPNDTNFIYASKIKAFGAGPQRLGKVGVTWAQFLGHSNMAPVKPWSGIMTFNAIDGIMTAENLTFSNFNSQCGYSNYVIAPNPGNDDGQHPVTFKNIKLNSIDEASKVWIHRPNINKINIWDCIDMDCDGLKKNLLSDLDGSFLGQSGHVISQSEYEWGNQQRGLGDFRIPKEALSAPNGTMIPLNQVYTYPGIVRDQCSYIPSWQAYKCHGPDYKMLIIESMDPDTLSRRISPVAIISDNKYLDLINGPQDHGCCFGYTCLKRISTFMALVVSNKSYDVYFSGTPPRQLRFRILNSDASFKIKLSVHYFTSNRIDVYVNDRFKEPTNGEYVNGQMVLRPIDSSKYMPSYMNASGTNLAMRNQSKVHFTIHGGDYLDLKVAPVLFVKFDVPAISQESFFNEATLVRNFADLLGIPESKIRRVSIVRETRRKRQAGTVTVNIEIGDNPVVNVKNVTASENIESTIQNISSKIVNGFATGQLQAKAMSTLNVTLTGLSVTTPESNGTETEIDQIQKVEIVQEASNCKELTPCALQPILRVLNQNNQPLTNIGSEDNQWTVEATLYNTSDPSLSIIYQTKAILGSDGFVRFTNLGVSGISTNFNIFYTLKSPSTINFTRTISSNRSLSSSKASFSCKTNETNMIVNENEKFDLTINVIDDLYFLQVKNLSQTQVWSVSISIFNMSQCQPIGSLITNQSSLTQDLSNGVFKYKNLIVSKRGMYRFTINIKTSSGTYEFSCLSQSVLVKPSTKLITINDDILPAVYFTFTGNLSQYTTQVESFKSIVYNCLIDRYDLTLSRTISVYDDSGKLMINTDFSGEANFVTQLKNYLKNGFNLIQGVSLIKADIFGSISQLIEETTTRPTTTTIKPTSRPTIRTTTTIKKTTTTTKPKPTRKVYNYKSEGCFKQVVNQDKLYLKYLDLMSSEDNCMKACANKGNVFATFRESKCYCGDGLRGYTKINQSFCNAACPPNSKAPVCQGGPYWSINSIQIKFIVK